MTSQPNVPEANAAGVSDAGTGIGNEISLGNLFAAHHAKAGQGAPALPGSSPTTAVTMSLLSHHQANLAAVWRSGQVLANGACEMRRAWAEASVASLKDTNEVMAALATVRCVKDLVDVQSRLVRSMIEKAFTRGAHVAGSSMALTHQVLEPISARMSASARAFAPAG